MAVGGATFDKVGMAHRFDEESTSKRYITGTGFPDYVTASKKGNHTYKDFNEAKGQLIANYQDYLEAVWINELEKKYPVKINDKLLRDIFIEK